MSTLVLDLTEEQYEVIHLALNHYRMSAMVSASETLPGLINSAAGKLKSARAAQWQDNPPPSTGTGMISKALLDRVLVVCEVAAAKQPEVEWRTLTVERDSITGSMRTMLAGSIPGDSSLWTCEVLL